jgi:hypothetical protein
MGATESAITESQHLFVGEDRSLVFDVTSDGTTPQTMTGWSLTWELLTRRGGTILITKSTGGSGITIGNGSGTNDRATVVVSDTDTEGIATTLGVDIDQVAGTYFHVLRRTDSGSESVLAFGDVVLQQASI